MRTDARLLHAAAVSSVLLLSACAVAPPSGPSVTALPGPGKSLDQFNADDSNCRNYAADRTQNAPQQAAAATNNANGTIAAGTLIGAGLGAALGSISGNVGQGAAIGAGAGLLAGASQAGDQSQAAADSLQSDYDRAYAQCMVGNGEALQAPPAGYAGAPPADDALPAAIATGAAAAILLSATPDHDDSAHGDRPDLHSLTGETVTKHDDKHAAGGAAAGSDTKKKKDDEKATSS